MSNERRLTVVSDELQASMLCALLEANGIGSMQRRTAGAGIAWGAIDIGMSGHREILVAADRLDEARRLLATVEAGDDVSTSPVLESRSESPAQARGEARQAAGLLRLRRGYAVAVLVLFGIPVTAAVAVQIVVAVRAIAG